ncbi:MAG: exodeoxyribonuclease VII large subunit [bacterium]|nr:exodeoxyribonuclease VII large subunit [bacterium]
MQLSLQFSDYPQKDTLSGTVAQNAPLQVTQLFKQLGDLLAQTQWTRQICVIGEVSAPKLSSSNHLFFNLKDQQSTLHCKLFYYSLRRYGRLPQEGERLLVYGSIMTYGPYGELYLKAERFSRDGQGELLVQLERLKEKLRSEHLFDDERKRPLPVFPRIIGLVTSENGMAFGDIKKIFRERAPHVKLWLAPALVQGTNASASMIEALRRLENMPEIDAIILGRGGGSREDLMAFNDENLVRAVASCPKPIVTAIGHDGDHSLCDLAADKVASTPTNAAEVILPSREQLLNEVRQHYRQVKSQLQHFWQMQHQALQVLRQRCQIVSPQQRIAQDTLFLNTLHTRLQQISQHLVQRWYHQLEIIQARPGWSALQERINSCRQETATWRCRAETAILDILSGQQILIEQYQRQLQVLDPHHSLKKGYALISDSQGAVISSIRQITSGQSLTVNFSDGQAAVHVEKITNISESSENQK